MCNKKGFETYIRYCIYCKNYFRTKNKGRRQRSCEECTLKNIKERTKKTIRNYPLKYRNKIDALKI